MTGRNLLLARAAASALFFGNGFGMGAWAAQLPRFKAELGLTDGQLSFALLAFGLGAVALMPVIGWVTALAGSGRVALVSAFAFAAALFIPGLAPSLAALVGAALLAGACNGSMDVSMNTNATLVERHWGRPIMSSFHAFFSLGGLAGASASGWLIAEGFGIAPTLGLSCSGMILLFLAAACFVITEEEPAAGSHGLALPRGALLGVAALTLMCLLVEGAMVDWTAIYLRTVAGAQLETAVAGFAAFSFTMMTCRFMGDFVVRRLGRVRTVMAGAGLAAAGLLLAMAVPRPFVASGGFALVGIGLANVVPILFSTAGEAAGVPPSVGVAMVATLGYAGLLLGPPLIGFGGDLVGLRAMLALLAVCAVAIVAVSRRVLRPGTL